MAVRQEDFELEHQTREASNSTWAAQQSSHIHAAFQRPVLMAFSCPLLSFTHLSADGLRARILDFRGFDSNHNLNSKGWNSMSMGNIPKILSQRVVVGIIFDNNNLIGWQETRLAQIT